MAASEPHLLHFQTLRSVFGMNMPVGESGDPNAVHSTLPHVGAPARGAGSSPPASALALGIRFCLSEPIPFNVLYVPAIGNQQV